MWYYWLLVIFMFLLCSGGGWWYRSWLQGRLQGGLGTPLPGMAPPMNPASAAVSALGAPSSQCCTGVLVRTSRTQPRFARITYHPSDAVALHNIWKGPNARMGHDHPPPPYSSPEGESSTANANIGIGRDYTVTEATNHNSIVPGSHPLPPCPYLLYGPPPSYDSILSEANQNLQEEGASAQSSSHDASGSSTVAGPSNHQPLSKPTEEGGDSIAQVSPNSSLRQQPHKPETSTSQQGATSSASKDL
ncbi:hypothetical protein J437_LFUL014513 [Ladona fulva]|uniref:Uncharacterized protein n=1 Tax=Ladona fulva TaxID=123851 RepID=A0A8K0KHP5_LADFU|nr:hypothetical protein J437_LFUL014513 [Ladona fulva]